MNAASIMDYVQALFSFFIAPLFGTVILGMLWKRATHLGGFRAACGNGSFHWNVPLGVQDSGSIAVHREESGCQANGWKICTALWSWVICVVVTVVVSLMTKPVPDEQLSGLVYGVTPIPDDV